MRITPGLVGFALVACSPEAETTEATETVADTAAVPSTLGPTTAFSPTDSGVADSGLLGPELDPDVATYVPADWAPTEVRRVIFFGDSVTAGEGVFLDAATYASMLVDNLDATWPTYADDDLTSRFGELEILDVSVSGATTDDVLRDQLPRLEGMLGAPPEGETLVIGTVGGNDLVGLILQLGQAEEEAARIADNVNAIARWFQDPQRFPGPTYVYQTNVYEPTDDVGQTDACFYGVNVSFLRPALTDINTRTLASAQADGWAWVDLYGHFLGHGFNHDDPSIATYDAADPTLWLAPDCVHPNDRGHHEVRRLFLHAIDNRPLPLVVP